MGWLSKNKNKLKLKSQKDILLLNKTRVSAGLPVYATLSRSNFKAFLISVYRGVRIRQRNWANRRKKGTVQPRIAKNTGVFAYSLLAADLNFSKTTAWRSSQKAKKLRFIKSELIKVREISVSHAGSVPTKVLLNPHSHDFFNIKYPLRKDESGWFYCTGEIVTVFINIKGSGYKSNGYSPLRDSNGNIVYYQVR